MRKTINKIAAGSAVALASALMLAGCGGGVQPGEAPGEDDSGETATGTATGLSVWSLTGGINEKVRTESFEWWNADHPDQQFTQELFADDAFKEKIRTAVGAGQAPTLIYNWTGGLLREYVDNGVVADITEGTKDVYGRVLPSVAESGVVDGKVYAIANSQTMPVVVYYNMDVLDEVGASLPTDWNELLEAVALLKDAGKTPIALAGQSKWPYLMYIQYLTDRVGGPEVFKAIEAGEPDSWSDPAVTEALTMIQELVEAGAFGEGFASVSADADADLALLYTGRAAMLVQGTWAYTSIKENAVDEIASGVIGATTFPAVPNGAGDPLNIVGNPSNFWAISATATPQEQEAAMEYLNTIVFDQQYTDAFLEGGGIPPVEGLESEMAKMDDAAFMEFVYGLVGDAPNFQLSWDQALPSGQAQDLLTNLEKIFMLQITPEEFVDNMNASLAK